MQNMVDFMGSVSFTQLQKYNTVDILGYFNKYFYKEHLLL